MQCLVRGLHSHLMSSGFDDVTNIASLCVCVCVRACMRSVQFLAAPFLVVTDLVISVLALPLIAGENLKFIFTNCASYLAFFWLRFYASSDVYSGSGNIVTCALHLFHRSKSGVDVPMYQFVYGKKHAASRCMAPLRVQCASLHVFIGVNRPCATLVLEMGQV